MGRASLFFKAKTIDKTKVPFHMCFEYFLYFFSKDRTVDVSLPNRQLKLSVTTLNNLLNMMAKFVSGSKWKFINEPDTEFIQAYSEIVREQSEAWEERRATIEKFIEELEKNNAAIAPPRPPVGARKPEIILDAVIDGTQKPQTSESLPSSRLNSVASKAPVNSQLPAKRKISSVESTGIRPLPSSPAPSNAPARSARGRGRGKRN